MARLRKPATILSDSEHSSDSDDSLPSLSEILRNVRKAKTAPTPKQRNVSTASRRSPSSERELEPRSRLGQRKTSTESKNIASEPSARKQRPLRRLPNDSSLLNRVPSFPKAFMPKEFDDFSKENGTKEKSPPRRRAAKKYVEEPETGLDAVEAEIMETSWCGSDDNFITASEGEDEEEDLIPFRRLTSVPTGHSITQARAPTEPLVLSRHNPPELRRPSTSSSADQGAILRFSPPRKVSPIKALPPPRTTTLERPTTPPPKNQARSKLVSPTKSSKRIPTPPHIRPSIDAFWQPDIINDWNDQFSPKKTLASPRKSPTKAVTITISDDESPSPPASPKKSASPQKKQRDAKKAFENRKHDVASSFLRELDDGITSGKLATMTKDTGGIKLIWTKKLNSTAGRANWRREAIRLRNPDVPPTAPPAEHYTTTYRHHASIELAEKVIDDEERLINVLAHEFCHLANFMISNVRNNPHGKEFKDWARKVTARFGDRGVEVTTKHSYAIAYKYIWTCVSCALEYKRHSKSIDPSKHTCGVCRNALVQTQPVPRGGGSPTEYQVFVKENYGKVKKECEGKPHAAVMERIGKLYREQKGKRDAPVTATKGGAALVGVLEKLTLDS